MIDSVALYSPSEKSKALLQKAFELIEVSNRQGVLLQEFEALIGGTPGTLRARKVVRSKSKVKANGRARKRNGESLVNRILSVVEHEGAEDWTAATIAKAIGEEANKASVVATIANLVKQGKLRRPSRGVFTKVSAKRPAKK